MSTWGNNGWVKHSAAYTTFHESQMAHMRYRSLPYVIPRLLMLCKVNHYYYVLIKYFHLNKQLKISIYGSNEKDIE